MAPADDLYPALGQSAQWTILCIALVAAVAVWWALLWWRTRTPTPDGGAAPWTETDTASARHDALIAIDRIVAEHAAGRLSVRAAFQQLSPLVRTFAFQTSGLPAHTMALADLERARPGALVDTVASMYPSEFEACADGDVAVGAEHARRFLTSWVAPSAEVTP